MTQATQTGQATQIQTDKSYVAEETVKWNFTVPNSRKKMNLLTIGGMSVPGHWYGELGQYFVAWSPLLTYDKDQFEAVIKAYASKAKEPKEPHQQSH